MHGEYKMPGGKLIVADLEVHDGFLHRVQISGDFFLEPDTALATIDNTLVGMATDTNIDTLTRTLDTALGNEVSMFGISSDAIANAVQRALETA